MNEDQWKKKQKERIKWYEEMAMDHIQQAEVCQYLITLIPAQRYDGIQEYVRRKPS